MNQYFLMTHKKKSVRDFEDFFSQIKDTDLKGKSFCFLLPSLWEWNVWIATATLRLTEETTIRTKSHHDKDPSGEEQSEPGTLEHCWAATQATGYLGSWAEFKNCSVASEIFSTDILSFLLYSKFHDSHQVKASMWSMSSKTFLVLRKTLPLDCCSCLRSQVC